MARGIYCALESAKTKIYFIEPVKCSNFVPEKNDECCTMEDGKLKYDVRITAMRQTVYEDLKSLYENPIEHACDVRIGQQWVSRRGERPEGMCPSAWESMQWFVGELAAGRGHFYDGWMRNPFSAMISCNDGFRPMSFLLERIEEDTYC